MCHHKENWSFILIRFFTIFWDCKEKIICTGKFIPLDFLVAKLKKCLFQIIHHTTLSPNVPSIRFLYYLFQFPETNVYYSTILRILVVSPFRFNPTVPRGFIHRNQFCIFCYYYSLEKLTIENWLAVSSTAAIITTISSYCFTHRINEYFVF